MVSVAAFATMNTVATFKVGLDSQGRPVLNVRSAEAFTDPVINFLVDLRWGKGELIREYSLLLDPAGFSSAPRMADAATVVSAAPLPTVASSPVVASSPAVVSSAAVATAQVDSAHGYASSAAPSSTAPIASQHRVVVRDTLRAIARRAGARTESQAQRMMIAIFRANPQAFEGNINVLHLGALLPEPERPKRAATPGVGNGPTGGAASCRRSSSSNVRPRHGPCSGGRAGAIARGGCSGHRGAEGSRSVAREGSR